MIKTIFFDFGGVIFKQPDRRWINRWKRLLGIENHPQALEMLENPHDSQWVRDICLGKLPEDYLWILIDVYKRQGESLNRKAARTG